MREPQNGNQRLTGVGDLLGHHWVMAKTAGSPGRCRLKGATEKSLRPPSPQHTLQASLTEASREREMDKFPLARAAELDHTHPCTLGSKSRAMEMQPGLSQTNGAAAATPPMLAARRSYKMCLGLIFPWTPSQTGLPGSGGAAMPRPQTTQFWGPRLELGREVYLGAGVATPWTISLPISFQGPAWQ